MSLTERQLFEEMAVRLAAHCGVANVTIWDELPAPFQAIINQIEYNNLIAPLVWSDRETQHFSWRKLSIKYRISVQTVRTILSKPRPNIR